MHRPQVRLVLEYMDRGTLRDALDRGAFLSPSGDGVNYVAVLETASEVAKGMLHLHSLNILHGDLKVRAPSAASTCMAVCTGGHERPW